MIAFGGSSGSSQYEKNFEFLLVDSVTSLIHDGFAVAVRVAMEVHDEQGDGDDVHENEEPIGERIQSYCYNWGVPKKLEIWHFEMKSGGPARQQQSKILTHHLQLKISF